MNDKIEQHVTTFGFYLVLFPQEINSHDLKQLIEWDYDFDHLCVIHSEASELDDLSVRLVHQSYISSTPDDGAYQVASASL